MEVSNIDPRFGLTFTPVPGALSAREKAALDEIIHAVESINSAKLLGESQELTFTIDRRGRRAILQIVDRKTREVVQEIPPEYLRELAQNSDRT